MPDKSSNTNIQVFLRVRPSSKAYPGFALNQDDGQVNFDLERSDFEDTRGQYVNNTKLNHRFKFNGTTSTYFCIGINLYLVFILQLPSQLLRII